MSAERSKAYAERRAAWEAHRARRVELTAPTSEEAQARRQAHLEALAREVRGEEVSEEVNTEPTPEPRPKPRRKRAQPLEPRTRARALELRTLGFSCRLIREQLIEEGHRAPGLSTLYLITQGQYDGPQYKPPRPVRPHVAPFIARARELRARGLTPQEIKEQLTKEHPGARVPSTPTLKRHTDDVDAPPPTERRGRAKLYPPKLVAYIRRLHTAERLTPSQIRARLIERERPAPSVSQIYRYITPP
jgi:hypothetical protein